MKLTEDAGYNGDVLVREKHLSFFYRIPAVILI